MSVPSLSSLAILELLSPDQQEDLYYVLRKKHIQRRSETNYVSIEEKLKEIENKYFDLVWYARKTDEDRETIPVVDKHMTRIEEEYPDEIHELTVYMPEWSHGFNSGALAISRLISAYTEESEKELNSDSDNENSSDQEESNEDSDENFRKYFYSRKGQIEMAENDFPMLDT